MKGKEKSLQTPILELLNPTCHSLRFCFALITDCAKEDLNGFENYS
jgi:hypothetical protein